MLNGSSSVTEDILEDVEIYVELLDILLQYLIPKALSPFSLSLSFNVM